jgi:hypothetical protein
METKTQEVAEVETKLVTYTSETCTACGARIQQLTRYMHKAGSRLKQLIDDSQNMRLDLDARRASAASIHEVVCCSRECLDSTK